MPNFKCLVAVSVIALGAANVASATTMKGFSQGKLGYSFSQKSFTYKISSRSVKSAYVYTRGRNLLGKGSYRYHSGAKSRNGSRMSGMFKNPPRYKRPMPKPRPDLTPVPLPASSLLLLGGLGGLAALRRRKKA